MTQSRKRERQIELVHFGARVAVGSTGGSDLLISLEPRPTKLRPPSNTVVLYGSVNWLCACSGKRHPTARAAWAVRGVEETGDDEFVGYMRDRI